VEDVTDAKVLPSFAMRSPIPTASADDADDANKGDAPH
jgi:hypothetical protein